MLEVDLDSAEPLYAQIVRGLRESIARGGVKVGERLPSVRQLAGDLGIHLNTVARAYRRLETDGLVRVRHGQGVVVVSDRVAGEGKAAARLALESAVHNAAAEARLAGLSEAEVRAVVERTLAASRKEGTS